MGITVEGIVGMYVVEMAAIWDNVYPIFVGELVIGEDVVGNLVVGEGIFGLLVVGDDENV